MYVSHLVLHDFRSYATADVPLEPGATAFIGRNGQGKTNLVEAIDYLSRLSSHRVATDAPLGRAGAVQAVIRASGVKDGRTAVRGGYGLYIDEVFLNPPLIVVLAQRARDITIVNPGYPDPFSRGTIQNATPSISVASENIRTPESKSFSLGF